MKRSNFNLCLKFWWWAGQAGDFGRCNGGKFDDDGAGAVEFSGKTDDDLIIKQFNKLNIYSIRKIVSGISEFIANGLIWL